MDDKLTNTAGAGEVQPDDLHDALLSQADDAASTSADASDTPEVIEGDDPRIQRANKQAQRYRTERNELRTEVESLRAALEELQKSKDDELRQRANDILQRAEQREKEAERKAVEASRVLAVASAGLPESLAKFVTAETETEIEAQVKELAAHVKASQPRERIGNGVIADPLSAARQLANEAMGRRQQDSALAWMLQNVPGKNE